jgi:tetratricopeptide (TPR) repeat protein
MWSTLMIVVYVAAFRGQPTIDSATIPSLSQQTSSNAGSDSGRLGVSAAIQKGNTLLIQGDCDAALQSFETALRAEPENIDARKGEINAATTSALKAKQAGDPEGALVYLARAKRYVPDDPSLLMKFSLQADALRFFHDADRAITDALRLRPNDPDLLYTLARVQLDEQKMPQSEENLRTYLKLRPADASAHFGLGHLLHMLQRNGEAFAELRTSLRLQPVQTESYYEEGQIYMEQQNYDGARKDFETVLKLNPQHAGVLIGMGILSYHQRLYLEAERYLNEGISHDPGSPVAHRYYSLGLARLGRTEESQRENDEASRLTREQTNAKDGYQLSPSSEQR